MSVVSPEQTFTVAEVAASLKVSPWWVREQCKAIRDDENVIVRPPVVTPLRIGNGRSARMRFTSSDVEQLHSALRQAPAVVPRDRRRRRRRRA